MASQKGDAATQEGRSEESVAFHDIEQGGGLADGSGVENACKSDEEDDGGPPLPLQHLEGTTSDRESKLFAFGTKDDIDLPPPTATASVAAAVAQSTIEQI